MEVKIVDGKLYFLKASLAEADWVREKLTFRKTYGKTTTEEKLFFYDNHGMFTFAGLLDPLRQATRRFEITLLNPPKIEFEDYYVDKNILPGKTLFDFQAHAVKKCLNLKKGIVQVVTGGGKTIISLALIKYLFDNEKIKNCFVLVPSIYLAEQFATRALQVGFTDDEIGIIHGYKKKYDSRITIAVSNSIQKAIDNDKPEVIDLLDKTDLFLADESHHFRADSWIKIISHCAKAEYMIGMTATPFHNTDVLKDAGDALVHGIMGSPIVQVSAQYVQKLGLIAKPIVCFTKVPGRMAKYPGRYNNVYQKYVVEDRKRTELTVKWANTFLKFNFPCLILVQRKEHARDLMVRIGEKKSICIFGNQTGMIFDEYGMLVDVNIDYTNFSEDFEAGRYKLAIASQVFDEGADVPSIGAVINAGAGKSKIKINQRTGRGLRSKKKGRNEVYIVDFMDRGHIYLYSQFKKRKDMYNSMSARIIDNEDEFWLRIKDHATELTKELTDEEIDGTN